MQVAGKTVLVTGGTDGIGLEIARQVTARGGNVIVCGRRKERLDAANAEGFEAIPADLSSAAGCAALIESLNERPLDILINNAGTGVDFDLSGPVDLAAADATIFLNFNAPIHLVAALLPGLRTRPEATIVNVTSGLAITPRAASPIYCASKAALRSFTMALRRQLKGSNIHVIEALPPVVNTAMTAGRGGSKMSPAACAAAIISAIEANRAEANVGMVKILKAVYSVSPALARSIMIRF